MKTKWKKLCSLMLSIIMCLTLLPITPVSATEPDEYTIYVQNVRAEYKYNDSSIHLDKSNSIGTVKAGTLVKLNYYTPDSGCQVGFTVNDEYMLGSQFIMPACNVTVAPKVVPFSEGCHIEIRNKSGNNNGSVSFDQIYWSTYIRDSVWKNHPITVYAKAKSGTTFKGWLNTDGEIVSSSPTFTFTPAEDTILMADFEGPDTYNDIYTENCTAKDSGGVAINEAYSGQLITLEANLPEYAVFVRWATNPKVTVTGNTFIMPAETVSVWPIYVYQYPLTISNERSPHGKVSIGGTEWYATDSRNLETGDYLIYAKADEGYVFKEWQDSSGCYLSSENPRKVNFDYTENYYAIFEKVPEPTYQIRTSGCTAKDSSGNIITSAEAGTIVYLYSDSAPSHTVFKCWSISGATLDGNKFVMPANDVDVSAVFATAYKLYVYPDRSEYGSVSKDGSHWQSSINMTVAEGYYQLYAKANEGYVFKEWNSSGYTLSTENPGKIGVGSDKTVYAVFEPAPIEEHTHNYVKTIAPASLTEDGKISFVCECGDVDSEEIIIPKAAIPYFVINGQMLSADSYPCTGNVISPTVVIRDSKGNDIDPENYTVTVPSGRKDVGTYTYQIEYKGKYTGTFERTLRIDIAQIFERTGANTSTGIKLTWEKALGAGGYYIYKSTTGDKDYKRIKTVTGLTYTDTDVTNGVKYNYKILPFKTVGDKTYKGYSATIVQYFISKPAISSLTSPSKTKALVKWAKNSKASGYQIQYSPKSDFSSGKKTITISGNTTVSKTIGSLTSGKKYYVRIRTFKKVSTGNYYSAWSAVKAVTVK